MSLLLTFRSCCRNPFYLGNPQKCVCVVFAPMSEYLLYKYGQTLKREISKARLKLVEPLIKGPAGLEYLRKAFTNRYGSPTDAFTSLSITKQWLSYVKTVAEQEWSEYSDSLAAMADNSEFSQGLAPTTLRTGGSILMGKEISSEISSPIDIKG